MARPVVVKLGGFAFPLEPDPLTLRAHADVLRRIAGEGHKLVVVAGGGELARALIRAARSLGAPEALCDELGIMASRLNAMLLAIALGLPNPLEVPWDLPSILRAIEGHDIVVVGGLQPGQSTDVVAVLAAELLGSKLVVKATDVDGVYTADPREHPGARKIDRLSYDEAIQLLSGAEARAGTYALLDLQAIRLAKRSSIAIRVVDGRRPENILKAIRGEEVGSLIGP